MTKIIRPFGLIGPKYKTDTVGSLLNYVSYIPALSLIGLVFFRIDPAQTKERMAIFLLVSLLFIAPLLSIAIMRSERIR